MMVLAIALLLLVNPCGINQVATQEYVSEDESVILVLSSDSTFTMKNADAYRRAVRVQTLETLSRGRWSCEHGLLLFNTPSELARTMLYADVETLSDETPASAFVIEFDSPYERWADALFDRPNFLRYVVLFVASHRMPDEYETYSNLMSVPLSSTEDIEYIVVQVVPDPLSYPQMVLNYISTQWIDIRNLKSNRIRVTIPDFTWDYLGLLRFQDYVVRSGDNGALYIHGRKYIPN